MSPVPYLHTDPGVRAMVVIARVGSLAILLTSESGCRSTQTTRSDANRPRPSEQMLAPDATGRVELARTGTTGIQGRWFANADTEACQKRGRHTADACSRFITPDLRAQEFAPTKDLGMCAVGIAAKVRPRADGNPDWGNMWGARMGLTLNDGQPYDAPAHAVTGFSFHIDSEPPPNAGIRVQLSTLTANEEPALWGGTLAESSPAHLGRNEFRWTDVGGPPWVANPPAFDPTKLLSIAFVIPAMPSGARSFSFCIRDLAALTD